MSTISKIVLAVCILAGIVLAVFMLLKPTPTPPPAPEPEPIAFEEVKKIGVSLEGRAIEAYTYGNGEKQLVFVGGIHGGYEWNSVLLAYELMDYVKANPHIVPDTLRITVIPSMNPDPVFDVSGKEGRFTVADVTTDQKALEDARFNANGVDLNRNFDCKWQPTSTWKTRTVNAGTAPHSEPESKAFVDFVLTEKPAMVLFWHSQASAVYASFCENGILPITNDIYKAYAQATGYKAEEAFTAYDITGDAGDWLAKIGVPAISVELTDHTNTEFERNLKGVQALLNYFK